MKRIQTKMLLFVASALLLSCILVNHISTVVLSGLYLEELYRTSEYTAKQIMQTTDITVRSVEDSLALIFNSKNVTELLRKTDFSRLDSQVFEAHRILDSTLSNFSNQFKKFNSLVFWGQTGSYPFFYYRDGGGQSMGPLMEDMLSPGEPSGGGCEWLGIVRIGNKSGYDLRGLEYAQVIVKSVTDAGVMRPIGKVAVFFKPDLFRAIYQDMEKTTGGRVLLLDSFARPVEEYANSSELIARAATLLQSGREVAQYVTDDRASLVTCIKSQTTGWSLICAVPLRQLTARISRATSISMWMSMAVTLIAGLIVYWFIAKVSRDIVAVSKAMGRVGKNDFRVRLATRRKDELGEIYRGFNSMTENLDLLFRQAIEQEKSRREAQLKILYNQIKPHFLYNTLASIRMYAMREGSADTADMLAVLNRLLRNTINIKDSIIPVDAELANLADYLTIFNVRYNGRINLVYDIAQGMGAKMIPNMVIQPLVENAIEHGFEEKMADPDAECCIWVRVFETGGALCIEVEDNGMGMTGLQMQHAFSQEAGASGDGHIGLRNIHDRLTALYGTGYGVFLTSEKGRFTKATLRLKSDYPPPGGSTDA